MVKVIGGLVYTLFVYDNAGFCKQPAFLSFGISWYHRAKMTQEKSWLWYRAENVGTKSPPPPVVVRGVERPIQAATSPSTVYSAIL